MPRSVNPKLRKGKYSLELPVAELNAEALGSFMRECLVPLLAKEFLANRPATSQTPIAVKTHKLAFRLRGEEGGPKGAVMNTIE